MARGRQGLVSQAWKTERTASGPCSWTQTHIPSPYKGLFVVIDPSASHGPGHRVNPFRTAPLSMDKVNGQRSPSKM